MKNLYLLILERCFEVIKVIVEQTVDLPVPQIKEEIVAAGRLAPLVRLVVRDP